MSVGERLLSWLGLGPPRPAARLDHDVVRAIAAEALDDPAIPLAVEGPVRTNGRVLWTVRTATVGRGVTVVIDDANGAVVSTMHWGVR